ncbi:MAG TPA: hypothetical protein VFJ61_05115 [Solirubrobacterales bacterium]|nr:hypothetical protein [Solirubrobacterales bacterium]
MTTFDNLLVSLAAHTLGALLRLCARHPCSATVLCSSVLGLDSLVAHGLYDTFCLWDWREGMTDGHRRSESKARRGPDELAEAGFSVWGWDDESIQIARLNEPSDACAPRHASLDLRRDIDGTPEEVREGLERL